MKRHLLGLSVFLTVSVLTSCHKENYLEKKEHAREPQRFEVTFDEEENARMILLRGDYGVTQADLLNRAESFIRAWNAEQTRTKGKTVKRTPMLVDSLVATRKVATKSGKETQEAKVYVVSFGDNAGYAFFGGDQRAGGLLGFCGEGNFDPATDNPGLRFTYGCMTQYVAAEIERLEALRGDSLYNRLAREYAPLLADKPDTKAYMPVFNGIEWIWTEVDEVVHLPEEYTYSWEIQVPELLKSYWNQWEPFNLYINQIFSQRLPVGCVATATAQIMNYHRYPPTYNLHTYRWNEYKNFHHDWNNSYDNDLKMNIAYLFADLGGSNNLNMLYAPDGSGAKDNRVPPTFRNFGYNSSDVKDYNIGTVIGNISQGRPVYLSGDNGQILGYSGHAWVGDGSAYAVDTVIRKTVYYYQGHEVGYDIQKGATNGRNYIHCNWGWSDRISANETKFSWFQDNIFLPIDRDTTQHNYRYNTKMVVDIHPK